MALEAASSTKMPLTPEACDKLLIIQMSAQTPAEHVLIDDVENLSVIKVNTRKSMSNITNINECSGSVAAVDIA